MLWENALTFLSPRMQLCLCAIPVFVKIPGMTNVTDLGSRTEGEPPLNYVTDATDFYPMTGRLCHQPTFAPQLQRCLWQDHVQLQGAG
jgi:hypothetical protein